MSVQEALKLGAFDLKKSANRNLAIAFGIALLIIAVLVGYPSAAGIFAEKEPPVVATGPTTLEDFQEMEEEKVVEQPPPDEVIPPPPPPPMAVNQPIGTGSDTRMGKLTQSDQDLSDLPDISGMEDVSFSDPKGLGDGGMPTLDDLDMNAGKDLKGGEDKVANQPTSTDEYEEFVGKGTRATYDNAQLLSNIVYPPQAEDLRIEGTVYVEVKLNERGGIDKATVVKPVDPLLDAEALRAVKKTIFTPGFQNGYPIKQKITIPVRFVLKD